MGFTFENLITQFTTEHIVLLCISVSLAGCAVYFFNTQKIKRSLVLLFLTSLAIGYFVSSLDPFLTIWDEQYHALVAKNLSNSPLTPQLYAEPVLDYDFKNWTSNHIWLHKQPLFLWQMALSIKIFGANTFALRLPSMLMHAFAALMIYRIGRLTISRGVGFYAALFFAFSHYVLELASGRNTTDHNDLAFLFYITASFWAWFEYKNSNRTIFLVLIGIFSGCAILTKWLVGLLIYAIWFFTIGVDEKKKWIEVRSYIPLLKSISITALIAIPWQIYILNNFPVEAAYEFSFNTKHFFEAVENHGGDYGFHFRAMNAIYGEGTFVLLLYVSGIIALIVRAKEKQHRVAIISAIVIVYGFYSFAATKMVAFCVIVSPFAYLGFATLLDMFFAQIPMTKPNSKFDLSLRITIVFSLCIFMLNLKRLADHHTDWKPDFNGDRITELKQMKFIEQVKSTLNSEKFVVFNADVRPQGHIELMFFTNHIAYPGIPSEETLNTVLAKSYKIAIRDNGQLPDYIRSNGGIVKIETE